jgi:hypothetical protein
LVFPVTRSGTQVFFPQRLRCIEELISIQYSALAKLLKTMKEKKVVHGDL